MDILTYEALDNWLLTDPLQPATIFGLDLKSRQHVLAIKSFVGCTFFGCKLDGATYEHLTGQGCAVLSSSSMIPFVTSRSSLYEIDDLYDQYDPADSVASWKASFDYSSYKWFMDETEKVPKKLGAGQVFEARLHDSSIEAAIHRFVIEQNRPLVGFMGGHDTLRSDPVFATVAELSRRLTREGLLAVTGGGPGLMEAANLGALLAPYPDQALSTCISLLAPAPKYDHPDWLKAAWGVRELLLKTATKPDKSVSLGIPTWYYGFEPPNVFASHHAKMFYNSLREDGLITISGAGLIIGPGNAGTVQEVFQDATQNYYRKAGTPPTPIALLGEAYWDRPASGGPDIAKRTKPLKPLLLALAGERPQSDWTSAVLVSDDVNAIADLVLKQVKTQLSPPTIGELWRRKLTS
jgi:predicted Rossmann-fold nucleotide-binding protein